MRPTLHINDYIAQKLRLENCEEKPASVRSIYRAAGRNSGLIFSIQEFPKHSNRNWLNAWLVLTSGEFSMYYISHIFWK
jgi:hypothetical protein